VKVVWHRELIRFWRDKPRIVAALVQAVLYLFVFGTGLGAFARVAGGVDLRLFLLPGVMAMSVLFTCFFSAGSIVWDREFGFLREMLVAPVRRSAIILGKCLGGATVGAFQGLVVLAVAAVLGVDYSVPMVLQLVAELLLIAFVMTALGLLIAARIRSMQSFMAVVQMLLMPMFFLSGALYPLRGLPVWLDVLTRLDPMTYAVDPMRRAVLGTGAAGATGVTWSGWTVPVGLELAIVAAVGVVALGGAVLQFRRAE